MSKLLVTGGSGMIGRALQKVKPDALYISSKDCNLLSQEQTDRLFDLYKPDHVIHLAAKVGGVKANHDNLGTFFTENIRINVNVLDAARKFGVKKLVSLLSTCVYPSTAKYPLTEDQINNGEPHFTNFAYAYAKRMLDVQSRAYRKQYECNFITAIPNNLFGEHDYFDLEDSHVIPAIIRKIDDASNNLETPVFWGNGSPMREFTYSQDLAKILLFLLENYDEETPINVGNTKEFSIEEVVKIVMKIMKYSGDVNWDASKLSGQYKKPSENKKLLDLGWQKKDYTSFEEALKNTCQWYKDNYPNIRGVNK
jgi:GDP-L-fucose synthase